MVKAGVQKIHLVASDATLIPIRVLRARAKVLAPVQLTSIEFAPIVVLLANLKLLLQRNGTTLITTEVPPVENGTIRMKVRLENDKILIPTGVLRAGNVTIQIKVLLVVEKLLRRETAKMISRSQVLDAVLNRVQRNEPPLWRVNEQVYSQERIFVKNRKPSVDEKMKLSAKWTNQ